MRRERLKAIAEENVGLCHFLPPPQVSPWEQGQGCPSGAPSRVKVSATSDVPLQPVRCPVSAPTPPPTPTPTIDSLLTPFDGQQKIWPRIQSAGDVLRHLRGSEVISGHSTLLPDGVRDQRNPLSHDIITAHQPHEKRWFGSALSYMETL